MIEKTRGEIAVASRGSALEKKIEDKENREYFFGELETVPGYPQE